jgi:hypothetical protein
MGILLHALSEGLDRGAGRLSGMNFGPFLALMLVLAILRNGIGVVPSIDVVRQISLDPTACPEVVRQNRMAQYLMNSYLGPMLGWLLHANGGYRVFALMHLGVFLAGFPPVMWQARRRFGDAFARSLGIAFVALPVSTTVLTWLGNADVFTFLLASVLFLGAARPALVLAGLLFGINHFEQGFFILLFTAVSHRLLVGLVPVSPLRLFWAALGLVLGKLTLYCWFEVHQFPLVGGRFDWLTETGVEGFAKMFWANLSPLLFSLFNVFWPAVLVLGLVIASRYPGRLTALAVCAGLALAVGAMTFDVTRVFALLSWPLAMAFLLLALKADPGPTPHRVMVVVLASCLMVPPLMVWAGKVHYPGLFNGPSVPSAPAGHPRPIRG